MGWDIRALGRLTAILLAILLALSAAIRAERLYGPLAYWLLRLAIAPPREV